MRLKLLTNDDREMHVDLEDIIISNLIKTVTEGSEEDDEEEIPLPNVSFPVLEKVVEFTRHYKTSPMVYVPKPLPSNISTINEVVGDWYGDYIMNLDEELLMRVIDASNYMDIEPLQEICCAHIATVLRGKEPDEVRRILGLDEEITNN